MAHKNRPSSQGSALISALFIMTLVAIATTAMSVRLHQDLYRMRLTLTSDKLYLASQAVTFWAMGILKEATPPIVASLDYPKDRQHDYPDIITTGQLIDLQGRFNLNQLHESESKQNNNKKLDDKDEQAPYLRFYRLLGIVLRDTSPQTRQLITQSTFQWVNEQAQGTGQDTTTAHYLKQVPPYSPSHQLMQSPSEFRLVHGVNETLFNLMQPYITALPPPTPINLNTASKPVLMALSDELDEASVETIIQARGEEGIQSMEDIQVILKKFNILSDAVTLQSEYFLCAATTRTHDLDLVHYTILKRTKNKQGQITVTVVHDSLNAY